MFTGIVREIGVVREVRKEGGGLVVRVEGPGVVGVLEVGASVAVDGVCLTVTALDERTFLADVSYETAARSTLGGVRVGRRVNLEPALAVGERLGGHLVSGHVDGVGRVMVRERRSGGEYFAFWVPPELRKYIASKASVAVDGVSLTVAEKLPEGFSVVVIPHTLAVTTLADRRRADMVNLECDILAKYVESLLLEGGPGTGDLTIERLRDLGF
ncbi:riboflavin synthase [Spirochaeta thermophila]|uniref:Riboflavin synthase n=1 Tax=Winmispira thermophila (strain ATCC 49972 / DSM 6192 / RI 19.B1) TaxID=665571 RepID=E0RQ35_WINT6|nr:riboflavin synthase [Spirochaeta thermophila]ADN01419.1 riboflavin synthase alpha chain [Spirochaeta thermophila DSM 6192]